MEIKIVWTNGAEKGLSKTIEYLKSNWTKKEILRLEDNINQFIERIKLQPNLYPKTARFKNLHKGMVDENNYIVYKISPKKKQIVIINFRDGKQKSIY
ncbi:type II toxin-antitoxin system RelE/ParE family toxin [Epilithonimonas hominis]|uniref:type II toxin-antitoxin system RelE/ParE family toxin n=1 Tax=Epilithonimonas hominis TaxID=420404 RepID=UPI0028A00EA9|nr:type II toxin-antitoxin system RelE/ParE family toxin [Epilithonimonas hominis]